MFPAIQLVSVLTSGVDYLENGQAPVDVGWPIKAQRMRADTSSYIVGKG